MIKLVMTRFVIDDTETLHNQQGTPEMTARNFIITLWSILSSSLYNIMCLRAYKRLCIKYNINQCNFLRAFSRCSNKNGGVLGCVKAFIDGFGWVGVSKDGTGLARWISLAFNSLIISSSRLYQIDRVIKKGH